MSCAPQPYIRPSLIRGENESPLERFDRFVLTKDLPEHGLRAGVLGSIMMVHDPSGQEDDTGRSVLSRGANVLEAKNVEDDQSRSASATLDKSGTMRTGSVCGVGGSKRVPYRCTHTHEMPIRPAGVTSW